MLSALWGAIACGASAARTESPPAPPVAASKHSVPAAAALSAGSVAPKVIPAPEAEIADAGVEDAAPDAIEPPRDASVAEGEPDLSKEPFRQPLAARRLLPPSSYARRFANLSPAQCMKELRAAKLPVKRWGGPAKGVANPLKLDGALSGVKFVFPGGKSPFGVLDCRLVLTLNQFARVLAAHDVVRVQLDNMYRPRSKLPRHRRGKARSPSQHSHGLAADITRLWLADGSMLSVADDWHGELGAPACGPDAVLTDPRAAAIRLRNVVCDVAREGIFTHMLTPGFDAAHRDHFHFDIKRDADYQALR